MVYIFVVLSLLSMVTVITLRKHIPDMELIALYCVYIIGLQPIYVIITINLNLIKMTNSLDAAIVTKSLGLAFYPIVSIWMVAVLLYTKMKIWKKLAAFALAHAVFSGMDFTLVAAGYLKFEGWGLWQSVLRHLVLSFTGLQFASWFRHQIRKERVNMK